MVEQLGHLVDSCGLTLGVPIESRVKTWSSVAEKLERKRLKPKRLDEIEDLVGIRVIFLFQRDLEQFHAQIENAFKVISAEDTSQRLTDAQFGYKSRHYILNLPAELDRVPTLKGLTQQKVELQVRTLAQHIWAAAAHKLQYKHEESVPLPLRRSIYRVSALLETVDLEFTRVLEQRDEYVKTQAASLVELDRLDVNVVEAVLDQLLPAKSKDVVTEDYSDLMADLQNFKIFTRGDLTSLISKHEDAILKADAKEVGRRWGDEEDDEEGGERLVERLGRGVFFTHVGLVRQALCEEFGDDAVRGWLLFKDSELS
ncbi:GTP pyrophosphokinase [Hydrogenophaga sp. R2]|uniref:GTP pyrophosphokinase n=1 Tax=Hydrogenophaga sp. R2 TaxID=3132827 RepID=UPI003CF2F900